MNSALEVERAAKAELERQLVAVQEQRKALDHALVEARRDFSLELGKLRGDLARSEERFAESEKRALLEIDRERLAAARGIAAAAVTPAQCLEDQSLYSDRRSKRKSAQKMASEASLNGFTSMRLLTSEKV